MTWLPWVLGVVLLGLIASLIWRVRRQSYVPWKDIPHYYPGSKWHARGALDPQRLLAALQTAEQLLIERTRWTAANLAYVGMQLRVYVMDSDEWVDLWGRRVAGLQTGHTLVVGPSLAALCHELAHLCEELLDKEYDPEHKTWDADGISHAVDGYQIWLTSRRSAVAGGLLPAPKLSGMASCRFKRPT